MNAEPNAALTYTMYAPPSDDVTSVKLIDARNGVFFRLFLSQFWLWLADGFTQIVDHLTNS